MHILVLSGGGAKGAYQAGCLEALLEKGKKFDGIVGTSVGALNAAALSMLSIEEMKRIWFGIKGRSDILCMNSFSLPFASGIFSMKPLKELLKKELYKTTGIKIPFWMGITDLRDTRVSYIAATPEYPRLVRDILASSAIPGVMEPIEDVYVDGGVRDIVPLSFPITQLGATEITVVSCSPYGETAMQDLYKWKPTFPKILSYMLRAIDTMTAEIQWQDMQLCKINNSAPNKRKIKMEVYAPDAPTIMEAIEFDPNKIKLAWTLGRKMAEKPIISF